MARRKSILAKLIEAIKPRRVTGGNPYHKGAGPGGGQFTSGGAKSAISASPKEYALRQEWAGRKLKQPLVFKQDDLPPIKNGYERLYHGTVKDNVQSISERGLLTGRLSGKGEQLPVVLASRKPGGFGHVDIVFDVPRKSIVSSGEWVEIHRSIKPSEIRAIMPNKFTLGNDEAFRLYAQYHQGAR